MKETRLIHYKGHLGRFAGTARDYDYSKPMEALAGATHVVTSGFGIDPAIRQGLGTVDGSAKEGVDPYNGLFGYGGKTYENTVGTVGNLLRLRFGAALGGLINIPGDAISDTADLIAGVRHNQN
jgi:hypothetical protein